MDIRTISGFLAELELNNNRAWFEEHRDTFKIRIEKPFREFIQTLLDQITKIEKSGPLRAEDAVFRIYRDIRFSKDKSPYKTYLSAIISPDGRTGMQLPGVYVELRADVVYVYAGIYQTDAKSLKTLRTNISERLDDFRKIYSDSGFKEFFGEIQGDKGKVLPAELKMKSVLEPLLYNKSFYVVSQFAIDFDEPEKLQKEIMARYRSAMPLNRFLRQALEE